MCADAAHMDAGRMVDLASGLLQGILDEESGGRGTEVVIVAAHVYSAQDSALELPAFVAAEDLKSFKFVLEPST